MIHIVRYKSAIATGRQYHGVKEVLADDQDKAKKKVYKRIRKDYPDISQMNGSSPLLRFHISTGYIEKIM